MGLEVRSRARLPATIPLYSLPRQILCPPGTLLGPFLGPGGQNQTPDTQAAGSLGRRAFPKPLAGTTPGNTSVWLPTSTPTPPHTHARARTPPRLSLVPPAWGLLLGQAWARLPGRTSDRCYKLGVCLGHGWGRVGPGPRGPCGGPDPDSPGRRDPGQPGAAHGTPCPRPSAPA